MYESFYKLANDPFRLLPDPGICFPHRSCAKAWAYLRYALKRGEGIVVVTGPPGSGKTTLAERLLNELNPSKTVSVRLIANDLNATDLLRKLAYSFGLPAEGMDRAMLAHRIERYLIELEHSQRRALVLIDEAQTLSHHSLEAMRLLTDLQSRSRPVLQLFLLGQEELEGVMCAPGMTQFQQRVIASSRLHTMDLTETKAYLEYRLGFADWAGDPSINGPAVMAIYRHSQGLPRHVNKICSRLLLHGCTEEKHALAEQDVLAVVQDLRDELLAPMNGEREATATLAGSAFGSIHELALAPAARSVKAAGKPLRDAQNLIFQADQQAQQAATGKPHQVQSPGTPRRHWQKDTPRYFYGTGYSRPHRLRRRFHRVFRALHASLSRLWGMVTRGVPSIRDSLNRVVREATAVLGNGLNRSHQWAADPKRTETVSKLRALWASVPRAVAAGLGALLVSVLAFVAWNPGSGTEPSLAEGRGEDAGQATLPHTGKEAPFPGVSDPAQMRRYLDVVDRTAEFGQLPGQGFLDTSAYRGLEESALPAMEGDGLLTKADIRASAEARRVSLLAHPSGMDSDLGQLVLGKVTGDIADLLVGRAAEARSMDVWALAWDSQPDPPKGELPGTTVADSIADPSGNAGPTADRRGGRVSAPAASSSEQKTADASAAGTGSPHSGRVALVVWDDDKISKGYVRFLQKQDPGQLPTEDTVAEDEPVADLAQAAEVAAISEVDPATESLIPAVDSASVVSIETEQVPTAHDDAQPQVGEKDAEVDKLLALADAAMERDRLMRPFDGSAYGYYRQVLAIDAKNEGARAGLDRVVRRYGELARWALDHQELEKAELYVGRGLQVRPDNLEMLALRGKVQSAIEDVKAAELAEAEQARLALEMRRAAPVVEPEVKQESGFSRLMRFVDGFGGGSGN